MEYIDKANEVTANVIVDDYLQWAQSRGKTAANLYADMRKHKFHGVNCKHQLIDTVLLPEQSHRCCYCMRHLQDHSQVTIEHVIPQSVTNVADMQHYYDGRALHMTPTNICETMAYIANGYNGGTAYPHKVAYHNCAAACAECNNARGNEVIEPMFFFEGIDEEVEYNDVTGRMDWGNDPVNTNPNPLELPTIEKVGLNNRRLRFTRAILFYLKRNGMTLTSISRDLREEVVYNVLGDILNENVAFSEDDLSVLSDMTTDLYWNQLSDYDYFVQD